MPLIPATDYIRSDADSGNLVVGNRPLPQASGICNIRYEGGRIAGANCTMVIQNECVCVSCQLYLTSCMRPKWIMTAAGYLHMTMFPFPSDSRPQSYAVRCRHSMASRSPAPQRPRGRRMARQGTMKKKDTLSWGVQPPLNHLPSSPTRILLAPPASPSGPLWLPASPYMSI